MERVHFWMIEGDYWGSYCASKTLIQIFTNMNILATIINEFAWMSSPSHVFHKHLRTSSPKHAIFFSEDVKYGTGTSSPPLHKQGKLVIDCVRFRLPSWIIETNQFVKNGSIRPNPKEYSTSGAFEWVSFDSRTIK